MLTNEILHVVMVGYTLGFKIEKGRKRTAIRKASVRIPQFIKEGMNASFQLKQHEKETKDSEHNTSPVGRELGGMGNEMQSK